MQIQKGKIAKPVHCVIYGTEGIGKTTIASKFPNPLFIDAEGGSYTLDVARVTPKSYQEVIAILAELKQNAQGYKTLVIDTADWLEKMLTEHICITNKMDSIETMAYGKGWVMVAELWKKLLDELNLLSEKQQMHILILAHSMIRHVDPPDAAGYDRYELKLSKQGSGIIKEWPDLLLFATYELFKVKTEGKDKVTGGRRIMYANHQPTFDAKNRFGLPDQMDFDFSKIAHLFTAPTSRPESSPSANSVSIRTNPYQSVQVRETPATPLATAKQSEAGPAPSCPQGASSAESGLHAAAGSASSAEGGLHSTAPAAPPPPASTPEDQAQAAALLDKIKALCQANMVRVQELQIDVAAQGSSFEIVQNIQTVFGGFSVNI